MNMVRIALLFDDKNLKMICECVADVLQNEGKARNCSTHSFEKGDCVAAWIWHDCADDAPYISIHIFETTWDRKIPGKQSIVIMETEFQNMMLWKFNMIRILIQDFLENQILVWLGILLCWTQYQVHQKENKTPRWISRDV